MRGSLIDRVRCAAPAPTNDDAPAAGLDAIRGAAPAIVELRERIARLFALERASEHTAQVVLDSGTLEDAIEQAKQKAKEPVVPADLAVEAPKITV